MNRFDLAGVFEFFNPEGIIIYSNAQLQKRTMGLN